MGMSKSKESYNINTLENKLQTENLYGSIRNSGRNQYFDLVKAAENNQRDADVLNLPRRKSQESVESQSQNNRQKNEAGGKENDATAQGTVDSKPGASVKEVIKEFERRSYGGLPSSTEEPPPVHNGDSAHKETINICQKPQPLKQASDEDQEVVSGNNPAETSIPCSYPDPEDHTERKQTLIDDFTVSLFQIEKTRAEFTEGMLQQPPEEPVQPQKKETVSSEGNITVADTETQNSGKCVADNGYNEHRHLIDDFTLSLFQVEKTPQKGVEEQTENSVSPEEDTNFSKTDGGIVIEIQCETTEIQLDARKIDQNICATNATEELRESNIAQDDVNSSKSTENTVRTSNNPEEADQKNNCNSSQIISEVNNGTENTKKLSKESTSSDSSTKNTETKAPQKLHETNEAKQLSLITIREIKTDVDKLKEDVEAFEGSKDEVQYVYLNEMLLRCQLKLDNVSVWADEDVRKERQSVTQYIQECMKELDGRAEGDEADIQVAF